jgi:hypothetical protein
MNALSVSLFFLPGSMVNTLDVFVVRKPSAGGDNIVQRVLAAAKAPKKKRKIKSTAWAPLDSATKTAMGKCYREHGV